MKTRLKIVCILILCFLLFKGFFYRLFINYNIIGSRINIEITDSLLINKIEKVSSDEVISLEKIIEIANSITCETLRFTTNKASNNPNELIHTNEANCIGYAAMFNSIANYLIIKNNLEDKFEAKHLIGKLDLFGIDSHQFFNTGFLRDHDFNQIKNLSTGQIISIDASVYDYLWISKVASNY